MATLAEQTLANLANKKSTYQWYKSQEAAQLQVGIDNLVNATFTAHGGASESYRIAKAWKTGYDKSITEADAKIAEVQALIQDIND